MDRELIRRIIIENQALVLQIEFTERPCDFEPNGNYVFVGVRQAGKSYMLFQRIHQLLRDGHSMGEMVYLNFDDERINSMKADELDLILQAHRSLYDCRPILFLDEIQNIDGWEHFARRLANEKYRVYITGSNARMLSRDIATTLGGRYWVKDVWPYTFGEYLTASGIALGRHWSLGPQQAEVSKAFVGYFRFGGFPELTGVVDKRGWLTSIYHKIFLGDIVVRNGVRNEEAVRMTVRRLADSVKQPVSYNRICNLVKSAGVQTNTGSVIDFVRYMKDSCLLFSLGNHVAKFAERESAKKHYFVDNGLLNLFLTGQDASLLENICAIHLYRKYGEELCFYNKNVEVDFYLPEHGLAVQASCTLADVPTAEREIDALVRLHAFRPLDASYIVTLDEEAELHPAEGLTVRVVPVWKWLLEGELLSQNVRLANVK